MAATPKVWLFSAMFARGLLQSIDALGLGHAERRRLQPGIAGVLSTDLALRARAPFWLERRVGVVDQCALW